jgi:hypothetical protein
VIGTGNQGFNDIKSFTSDDCSIVAVCDVNRRDAGYWEDNVGGREPARRLVEERYARRQRGGTYRGCDAYVDYREILGRQDIDAVEVCTPDHWHAIAVIAACKAKKDIYCQKPLSLTIAEGRAMSDAVKKYERVLQTGSQQRSDSNFRSACELVRNGGSATCPGPVGLPAGGPITRRRRPAKPEPVPKGFNTDFRLGPAPTPLRPRPLPRQLPLDPRLFRRPGDRLGQPPSRLCPVGDGDRDDQPDRDPQRQGTVPSPTRLWNTATEFSFEAVYDTTVNDDDHLE